MSINPPTPLTPRERDALDRLEQWIDGWDDPKPRETVVAHLIDNEFERAEAQRLIDNLLSKGYLYEHDGIRVTNAE